MNPAAVLLAQAKRRAKQSGIPFNIGLEDISIPGLCPALKIPLFPGRKKVGRNSPSLDRLVPELGYTKGNVVVISHRANTLKNDATPVELEAIASWLRTAIRP